MIIGSGPPWQSEGLRAVLMECMSSWDTLCAAAGGNEKKVKNIFSICKASQVEKDRFTCIAAAEHAEGKVVVDDGASDYRIQEQICTVSLRCFCSSKTSLRGSLLFSITSKPKITFACFYPSFTANSTQSRYIGAGQSIVSLLNIKRGLSLFTE
jgi:hypothetical protein